MTARAHRGHAIAGDDHIHVDLAPEHKMASGPSGKLAEPADHAWRSLTPRQGGRSPVACGHLAIGSAGHTGLVGSTAVGQIHQAIDPAYTKPSILLGSRLAWDVARRPNGLIARPPAGSRFSGVAGVGPMAWIGGQRLLRDRTPPQPGVVLHRNRGSGDTRNEACGDWSVVRSGGKPRRHSP